MAFKLTRVPGTNRFEGKTGDSVTLVTKNLTGNVAIARADYADKPLVVTGGAITFKIVEGMKVLVLVFDCLPETATGKLHEKDGDNTRFMRNVFAHSPAQAIVIEGES